MKRPKALWNDWDGKLVDLHVYGGLVLLAVGFWLIHPGAAFAIPGAVLVYIGLRGS